jgi:hypothetical protein
MADRYRLELTDWSKCDYDQKNHVYITQGSYLIGYVPVGGTEVRFAKPKKQWSVTRRKFRDLKTKEIQQLRDGFFPS